MATAWVRTDRAAAKGKFKLEGHEATHGSWIGDHSSILALTISAKARPTFSNEGSQDCITDDGRPGVRDSNGVCQPFLVLPPISVDVKADYGKADYGKPLKINGMVDASVGGLRQIGSRPSLGPGVPSNIRALVSGMAARSASADVLEKLEEKLSSYGNLLQIGENKTFVETVFDSMEEIRIDPKEAGSGARTNGSAIYLNKAPNGNQTFINNFFAKFTLQELVHNFRTSGMYSDSTLDKAGLGVLDDIDPIRAASERERRKEKGYVQGSIGHRLVTGACQYSQHEIDTDGKEK